jgi:hypothetical protein
MITSLVYHRGVYVGIPVKRYARVPYRILFHRKSRGVPLSSIEKIARNNPTGALMAVSTGSEGGPIAGFSLFKKKEHL